jgi:lysophospholipase L1-like esterase
MPLVNRSWILGGLLVAGGIGVARLVAARPKIREDTRLLLLGDSMAEGLGPHLKALATEQGIPYVGAGVSGSTIPDWTTSHWLEGTLDTFAPTLVVIVLGTNDAFSNYTPEQSADHARMLLGKIPLESEVVWIGPPLLPETYAGRHPNPALVDSIEKQTPQWFDSSEWVIPRGPDDLHPTAHGYAGWAGAIWGYLT